MPENIRDIFCAMAIKSDEFGNDEQKVGLNLNFGSLFGQKPCVREVQFALLQAKIETVSSISSSATYFPD